MARVMLVVVVVMVELLLVQWVAIAKSGGGRENFAVSLIYVCSLPIYQPTCVH